MNDTQQEADSSKRPAASFSGTGGLNVAVWKHASENEGQARYSVKIERSYKDGDDYKQTEYLRDNDLLRLQQLLIQADQWIEQDKGRGLSKSSGYSR